MVLSAIILLLLIRSSEQWLSIIQLSNVQLAKQDICHAKYGLNQRQILFCQRNKHIIPFIHTGTNLAIEQCRIQFKNRHWNCTLFKDNHLLGDILDAGTKESAYIHALTSAGIAYVITKACSKGQLEHCGCDMTLNDNHHNETVLWTGCSDNVLFATEIARRFVNFREHSSKIRMKLLNIHNNQIGIRTVLSSVDQHCKCFGVSGSCEYQSCWRSLRSFAYIANQLKELYDNAIEVYLQRNSINRSLLFIPKHIPIQKNKHPSIAAYKNDLIFINPSPNYCEPDLSAGSIGTTGRLCNRNSRAIDSCDLLCCNRGYESQIVTINTQCKCRFQWCCRVDCENCMVPLEISRCL